MSIFFALSALSVLSRAQIQVNHVPEWDNLSDIYLSGKVESNPSIHKIITLLYFEGLFYAKPYSSMPYTPIMPADSSFHVNVVTGGCDQYATRYFVAIADSAYALPAMDSFPEIPAQLLVFPHILINRHPGKKHIQWAGINWIVKETENCMVGPGNPKNYFSDDDSSVFVAPDGLHLAIRKEGINWYSAEILSEQSLGYGTYEFVMSTPVTDIDVNGVFGFFTWDELYDSAHREIDIEFSEWADPLNPYNAQYVVQPWMNPLNIHKYFITPATGVFTRHRFLWKPDTVFWMSFDMNNNLIQAWEKTGGIPVPGNETVRFNHWLFADSTSTGLSSEVVIQSFMYVPLASMQVNPVESYGSFVISPNPAEGTVQISFSSGKGVLEIYSITGTLFKREVINTSFATFNIPGGMYYFRLSSVTGHCTRKVIVF